MRLAISDEAERDLEEIGDFIAIDNPAAAARIVRDLRAYGERLLAFPLSHPPRAELGADVRLATRAPYVILYRVLDDAVRIERILHGARDLRRVRLDP